MFTNINPTLIDESLYHSIQSRNELSQSQMAIGSTNVSQDTYISYDDETTSDNTSSDDSCSNEDVLLYKIFKNSNTGTFNTDDIIVSAVHTGRHQGIKVKDPTKLCHID